LRSVAAVMSKIEKMRELMHNVVQSLHNRSPTYHYKLTGDDPESLSRLLDLEEAGMHHLLFSCGFLSDVLTKKYKKSGVVDQHDMFAPCTILHFAKMIYNPEKDKFIRTREYYLSVGKDNNELRLPNNQYVLATSPDDENKTKKIHSLEILPPAIRLNKYEKEVIEKLKVLVFQSMPTRLERRKQSNVSGKNASAVAAQPQSVTTALPSSSAKKNHSID
jgi:hypothetical protein